MAKKLPPLPIGVIPGSGYWNDWYEKLRTLVNEFLAGITWSSITGTPTTLGGYGITDGTPISHVGSGGTSHAVFTNIDAGFAPASGGGIVNFLRADGSWSPPGGGGGGSVIGGVVSVSVPASGRFEWEETVAAVGVLPGDNILVSLGEHLDSDENHQAGLWILSMGAAAGTDTITVSMSFGERTAGVIKLNYMVI